MKPKKLGKKLAQRTLKEKRADKRAAGGQDTFQRALADPTKNGTAAKGRRA